MDSRLLAVRQRIEALERALAESRPAAAGDAAGAIVPELSAIAEELRRREMALEARRQAFEIERQRTVNPSEERFESAFAHAPIGIGLVAIDGRTFQVNRALCEMLGYSAEEILSGAVVDVSGTSEIARGFAYGQQLLRGERRSYQIEKRFRHKDGHVVEALLSVSLVRGREGQPPYFICQLVDVTDRRRAEEAAHQRQAELAQVLRVHTIGEMAAGLAHEINQPLAAIVNYARGCARRLEEQQAPADVVEVLGQITGEGLRAAAIVRGLRRFLRKEPPRHAREDLNALVTEALLFSEADARQRGIVLTSDLARTMPAVQVDRVQIEQVLVNLIRNGLEAMSDGPGARRELSVQTAVREDDALAVAVRDGGSGVSPDIAEQIFDPFFTTKPSGLGMGLAISRSIIHAHGGKIWAAPNADGGTTVSFTLPRQRAAEN